jgi:integrase
MNKHLGIYEKNAKSGKRYQVKWRQSDGTQTSRNFRTLREAKEFKKRIDYEKSLGTLPDRRLRKVKFSEFASEVFSTTSHRPSTARRRDGIMKKYLLPLFGKKPLSEIHRTHIIQAMNCWASQGLSPRTIINHLNVLRPIFAEAVHQNILVKSPMEGVKRPRTIAVKRRPLSPEQCHALLREIDPRYAFAVHFVLATGVRWGEFANLRIRDFRPLSNLIQIADSKTEAGIREIALDPLETLRISRHIAETNRTGADGDSPLFTSPDGKPLHYSNFRRRVFEPACRRAGLNEVTFHDLRRTHATMLVAQGHDLKVIQERMGHRSITTTLDFYAQATEQGKMRAAGAKEQYLDLSLDAPLRRAE